MEVNESQIVTKLKKIASEFTSIHVEWHAQGNKLLISEPLSKIEAEDDAKKLCRIFDTDSITIQTSSSNKNLFEVRVPIQLVAEKSPLESLPKLFMYLSGSDLQRLPKVSSVEDFVSDHDKDVAHRFSEENKDIIQKALEYMNRELHADQWEYLKIEPQPHHTDKVFVTRHSKVTQKNEIKEYPFQEIIDYAASQKNWKKAA